MGVNQEDCVYFEWLTIMRGCCGRPPKAKQHSNCTVPGKKTKICNTDMYYCRKKARDEKQSN